MALIVPRHQAEDITHRLEGLGERAYLIGEIEQKGAEEASLIFDPGHIQRR